jgi:hypothetical protein
MNDELKSVLDRFRLTASRFVETVDSAANHQLEAFLSIIGNRLAELYCIALQLPSVEPDTSDVDRTSFSTEEWAILYESLRRKIGPFDVYWAIFDPTEESNAVQGSLAQDISEIYYDLKFDLSLADRVPQNDWLWELRFSFRTHWGTHLMRAMAAIHELKANETIE